MADHRDIHRNARTEAMLKRIADALGVPVGSFSDAAMSGSPREATGCAEGDSPGRPGADRRRQAAEMLVAFERVSDPAEREACLAFVRVRAGA